MTENRKHLNSLIDKIASEEISREQLLNEELYHNDTGTIKNAQAADSTTPDPSPVKPSTSSRNSSNKTPILKRKTKASATSKSTVGQQHNAKKAKIEAVKKRANEIMTRTSRSLSTSSSSGSPSYHEDLQPYIISDDKTSSSNMPYKSSFSDKNSPPTMQYKSSFPATRRSPQLPSMTDMRYKRSFSPATSRSPQQLYTPMTDDENSPLTMQYKRSLPPTRSPQLPHTPLTDNIDMSDLLSDDSPVMSPHFDRPNPRVSDLQKEIVELKKLLSAATSGQGWIS